MNRYATVHRLRSTRSKIPADKLFVAWSGKDVGFVALAPARGGQFSDSGELRFRGGWCVGQIGAVGHEQVKVVVIAQIKANHGDFPVVPAQHRAAVARQFFQRSGQHVVGVGLVRCQILADFAEIGRRYVHGVAPLRVSDHPVSEGGKTFVLARR